MGRAALVFLSPHVLNPADNVAEYGWQTTEPGYGSVVHTPPHGGACVVAWFRPPVGALKYNVNFSCEAVRGHSLVLTSEGDSETVNISADNFQTPEALALTKAA